jgi:L-amino acid N-acyltransferase YncA
VRTVLGFIFAHNTPSMRLFESFGFQKQSQCQPDVFFIIDEKDF